VNNKTQLAYSLGVKLAFQEHEKNAREKDAAIGPILAAIASKLPSLGHVVGTAAAGHIGTNALGRAAHHASNIGEVLAHKGFQHGLLDQGINPARKQAIKMMFGPEALIPYEAAHQFASKAVAQAPHPTQRAQLLNAFLSKDISHAPVLGNVQKAIQHELAGSTPQFAGQGMAAKMYGGAIDSLSNQTRTGFETPLQKVVESVRGASPLAPMLAADAAVSGGIPLGAVGHMGWNMTRQAIGDSALGQRLAKQQLLSGLKGKSTGGLSEMAHDLVLSPAFLDAQRLGKTMHTDNPAMAGALHAGLEHATPEQMKALVQQHMGG